ncbi:hypothetical protein J7643_16935 [bacterium]|nr:hypothetical protein [bacterium]
MGVAVKALAIAATVLGTTALPAFAGDHMCGGGGGAVAAGTGACVMQPYTKQWGLSGRVFANQGGNGHVYTMMGLEMLKVNDDGWSGGFAMFRGLNLGDQTNVDATTHGGFLVGKAFDLGAMSLGLGVLLGGGCIITVSPTLGFSNFGAFFAGEPRVSLGLNMDERHSLTLTGSYLATTRMSQVSGPAVTLTWSTKLPKRCMH